jgi:hypothetical protein
MKEKMASRAGGSFGGGFTRTGSDRGSRTCRPAPEPGAFVGESDGADEEGQGQNEQVFASHKIVFYWFIDGDRMPDVTFLPEMFSSKFSTFPAHAKDWPSARTPVASLVIF